MVRAVCAHCSWPPRKDDEPFSLDALEALILVRQINPGITVPATLGPTGAFWPNGDVPPRDISNYFVSLIKCPIRHYEIEPMAMSSWGRGSPLLLPLTASRRY